MSLRADDRPPFLFLLPGRYVAHEDSAWVTVAPGPLPAIKIRLDRTGGAQPHGVGGEFPDFVLE